MSYYDRALEMKDELVTNRRYLHENAEVGLTLPKTRAFIEEKLREYGIEPQRCGEGVTGLIGKGGKVLLLRADMDALAMPEESGLPFASKDPKAAHCCGHDMHATMLLGAAKMLKEHESELKGTVKADVPARRRVPERKSEYAGTWNSGESEGRRSSCISCGTGSVAHWYVYV